MNGPIHQSLFDNLNNDFLTRATGPRLRHFVIHFLCFAGLVSLKGCSPSNDGSEPGSKSTPSIVENPTFCKDVAPIVLKNCASCHRPGESAPFSLLNFEDVHKHGPDIAEVTQSGYMPPWLPQPHFIGFKDERRMKPSEIELIARWVDQGMVEGNASDLPPQPVWTAGWQLGEPDLIVEMPEPYLVPAEGENIFRNFVLPVSLEQTRFVRGVEIRPSNPKVVHHGVLLADQNQAARRYDARDSDPGYLGMQQSSGISSPGGHFLGWTPGKVPVLGSEDMAWRLVPGTDLVASLHLLPSGKEESLSLRVGLHFTDKAPTKFPVMIELESQTIDIPANEANYLVEEKFPIPVGVNALSIYPHAHYLAKEMHVFAKLPDKSTLDLLHIKEWNFDWQDDYRFSKPIPLPPGTDIVMRFTYDNSDANPRNPFSPSQPIVYGGLSTNEMGSTWLQVLPESNQDLLGLYEKTQRHNDNASIKGWEHAIEKNPDDAEALNNLGAAYHLRGRAEEAENLLNKALALDPLFAPAHFNIGLLYLETERFELATAHFHGLLKLEPDHAGAYINLGTIADVEGDLKAAIHHFTEASRIRPDSQAYFNLGSIHLRASNPTLALLPLKRALDLDPLDVRIHMNLGVAHFQVEDWSKAEHHFSIVTELEPGFATGYVNLGNALMRQKKTQAAVQRFSQALEIDPNDQQAKENLNAALITQGKR